MLLRLVLIISLLQVSCCRSKWLILSAFDSGKESGKAVDQLLAFVRSIVLLQSGNPWLTVNQRFLALYGSVYDHIPASDRSYLEDTLKFKVVLLSSKPVEELRIGRTRPPADYTHSIVEALSKTLDTSLDKEKSDISVLALAFSGSSSFSVMPNFFDIFDYELEVGVDAVILPEKAAHFTSLSDWHDMKLILFHQAAFTMLENKTRPYHLHAP